MTQIQSALVVGASRGIGLGLVEELLKRGARVWATVRDDDGETTLKGLTGADRLTVLRADVTADDDAARLARDVEGPLDLLFVNAGVMGPRDLASAGWDQIDETMRTNAFGPARLAWALLDRVRDGAGVLALMTSGMGSIQDNTSGGFDVYRASKAAQNMLARGLSLAGRDRGLTVLSVNPGWVRTDMGGDGAAIDVATSSTGIVDQLERHAGRGGHHFVGWNGRELPW